MVRNYTKTGFKDRYTVSGIRKHGLNCLNREAWVKSNTKKVSKDRNRKAAKKNFEKGIKKGQKIASKKAAKARNVLKRKKLLSEQSGSLALPSPVDAASNVLDNPAKRLRFCDEAGFEQASADRLSRKQVILTCI